jgi:hypothetical protein
LSGREAKVSTVIDRGVLLRETIEMPASVHRYQQTGHLHFIPFSCYRRQPNLATSAARDRFEESLAQARRSYGLGVLGYVVNRM